jgi:hypothetical protein
MFTFKFPGPATGALRSLAASPPGGLFTEESFSTTLSATTKGSEAITSYPDHFHALNCLVLTPPDACSRQAVGVCRFFPPTPSPSLLGPRAPEQASSSSWLNTHKPPESSLSQATSMKAHIISCFPQRTKHNNIYKFTFPIPNPQFSNRLKVPANCNTCHFRNSLPNILSYTTAKEQAMHTFRFNTE